MAFALSALMPLLVVLALLVPDTAGAQALMDPTRPTGSSAAAAVAGGEQANADGAPERIEVQSILIKPNRKPMALLNGKWVEQGQIYGDSRVLKVTRVGVILQKKESNGTTSSMLLRLNPEVEKREPVPVGSKRPVEIK